jgi:hypothetical protein
MGWIGSRNQLFHVLRSFGCDEKDGQFCVDGNITTFLGMGEEFVVGDDAVYYVNNKPCNLCNALKAVA